MEELFLPYEQALKLKELGFDEPCLRYFDKDYFSMSSLETQGIDWTLAPLWQQAFDWFRDQGYIIQLDLPDYVNIEGFDNLVYYFKISDYDGWRGGLRNTYKSESYDDLEEERQACLEKLIEIAQKTVKGIG